MQRSPAFTTRSAMIATRHPRGLNTIRRLAASFSKARSTRTLRAMQRRKFSHSEAAAALATCFIVMQFDYGVRRSGNPWLRSSRWLRADQAEGACAETARVEF